MPEPEPAAPARSIFYGFGAWVGRLDGPTACAWWPDDPNHLAFDRGRLIEVDLAKNPAAYLSGAIALEDLQVDDAPGHGGLTTLGPTWPTGSTVAGVWLEAGFHARLPNQPELPQRFVDGRDYELTSVVYWAPGGGGILRRCWGVHAEISAEQGSLALCTLWTPGTSLAQRPAGTWWIDLAAQAVPITNGLTVIGTGRAPKRGALFLDALTHRGLGLASPKIPPSLGGQLIPPPRGEP